MTTNVTNIWASLDDVAKQQKRREWVDTNAVEIGTAIIIGPASGGLLLGIGLAPIPRWVKVMLSGIVVSATTCTLAAVLTDPEVRKERDRRHGRTTDDDTL